MKQSYFARCSLGGNCAETGKSSHEPAGRSHINSHNSKPWRPGHRAESRALMLAKALDFLKLGVGKHKATSFFRSCCSMVFGFELLARDPKCWRFLDTMIVEDFHGSVFFLDCTHQRI